jgi:hypothetical protein
MRGAIPSLPSTPWRSAQLKHRDKFTFENYFFPFIIEHVELRNLNQTYFYMCVINFENLDLFIEPYLTNIRFRVRFVLSLQ